MHGVSPDQVGEASNTEVYFEFDFFDGIMVDCKKVNCTEWTPRAQDSNENRPNITSESEAPRLLKAGAGYEIVRGKQEDWSGVIDERNMGSRRTSFSQHNGVTVGSEWARLCAVVMDNQMIDQSRYIMDYRRSSFSDYNEHMLDNQRAYFSNENRAVMDYERDDRHVAMLDNRRASFSGPVDPSSMASFSRESMPGIRKARFPNENEAMINHQTACYPARRWDTEDNCRANLMNHNRGTVRNDKMISSSDLLVRSETNGRNIMFRGDGIDQHLIHCKERSSCPHYRTPAVELCRKSVDSVKDDIQFSFLRAQGNVNEQQLLPTAPIHSAEHDLKYDFHRACGCSVSRDALCGHENDLSVKNPEQSYGHSSRDLSSGHYDWLWCEEAPSNHVNAQVAQSLTPHSNGNPNKSCLLMNTPDEVCNLMGNIGLGGTSITADSHCVVNGNGKPLGQEDSPRCSSMSLTDLIEVASPGDNFRELTQQAVLNLRNSFLNGVPLNEMRETVSHSMNNSKSTSRRNSTGSRADVKMLSLVEPSSFGTVHGLLHVNSREGLPNYTFLLDEYDEIILAKTWTEDVILSEEHANWRYSFYSLRGNSKKSRSGWKHWGKKEKLESVLVGKMRVSSMVLSEKNNNGETILSVQSEFVLSGPKFHGPESSLPMNCLASPGNSPRVCNGGGSKAFTSSSSPSQSHTSSSSGGQSSGVSPSNIPTWYVSQSLIPYASSESRHKSSKWNFWKAKKMKSQSSSFLSLNSCLNSEYSDDHVNYSLGHAELAAMVISVPLGVHNSLTKDDGRFINHRNDSKTNAVAECQNQTHKHNQEASIKVILPCGSHGKPVTDAKGPSPLIKRWKEGGQCDCKGWDLGCGITVLSNKRQKSESRRSGEFKSKAYQSQDKKLVLYKEDGDNEDAIVNLSPHENGLIAVDFCGFLSPLQAFAIAVGILHGRASNSSAALKCNSIPEMECSHKSIPVRETTIGAVEPDGVTLGQLMARESESKMLTSYIANGNSAQSSVKVQGGDVFNCASGPALSFERL